MGPFLGNQLPVPTTDRVGSDERSNNEDLPRLKDDGHPGIVACGESIAQLSSAIRVGLFFPEFCSVE